MEEIILTENLSKRFGKISAVKNLTLRVRKGEIYGFLGLNGAGKTTTIRMLLGMIRPSSGKAFLKGIQIKDWAGKLWNKVGHLVEIPYAYPELTVRENLELIAKLRFLSRSGTVNSVMEQLGLSQYRDRKVRHLSLGNAQRLGLAKALIHNPEILILDEPSNSLDPAGIAEIRSLIQDLAHNQGVTVFLSSHILGEISKSASRIGIIHQGSLAQEINAGDLEKFRLRKLQIKTGENTRALQLLRKKGFTGERADNGILEFREPECLDYPDKINLLLHKEGIAASLVRVEEEDLEQYFLRLIGISIQE